MPGRIRTCLLVLLLLGPFQPIAATDGVDEGILWRVESENATRPSFIFGTVHSTDERVLDLPKPVEDAFGRSDRYRFEIDFDRAFEGEGMMAMFYLDGRHLSDQLPDALWQRTRDAAVTRNISERDLEIMKPWAVAIVLAVPQEDPTRMLDYVLYQRARRNDRPVAALETIEEQYDIFDQLAIEQQVDLLRNTVDHVEDGRIEPMYEEMIGHYLERDLAGMVRTAAANPLLPGSSDGDEALMRRLVEDRNRIMVTRMDPDLRKGGTFVAIGALHLPGKEGLIRLLEERGYSVSVVY